MAGVVSFAIEYTDRKPTPIYCDFTKMAYQSPEFIDHYFGPRQHTTWTPQVDVNGSLKPGEMFEYEGDNNDLPYVGIQFYKGQAIEMMVFFFQPQTPDETARRVGLNISAFHPISSTGYASFYKGTYKGINYRELGLTNIKNTGDGSRNAVAVLSVPNAPKS